MGVQSTNDDGGDNKSVAKFDRYRLHEAFASSVTLHGYRYLFDSNSSTLRRGVWCIVFFSALVFGIVLFVGVVQDYFMYKSFTVIKVDTDVKGGLNFPTLTFCYNEPFTLRNLRNLNVSEEVEEDIRKLWKFMFKGGPKPHSLLERIFANNGQQIFDDQEKKEKKAKLVRRASRLGASKKRNLRAGRKRSKMQDNKTKNIDNVKENNVKDNEIKNQEGERKGMRGKERSKNEKHKKQKKKKKDKGCEHVFKETHTDYESDYEYILNMISAINIKNFLTDPVSKQFLQNRNNEIRYETCRFRHSECKAENIKMVQLATGQPCLQFNPYSFGKESLRQDGTSPNDGLTAFLDLHRDDMTLTNKMRVNNMVGAGVYVMINPYGVPVEEANQLKVMLQPGKLTMINLQGETVVEELPPPHGKCGRKEYAILKPHYPYSNQMCSLDCNLQHPIKKCGCVSREMKEMVKNDVPICSMEKMVECWNIERKSAMFTSKAKICRKKTCKPGCGHTEYLMRSESNDVGTYRQIEAIKEACNNSRIQGRMIRRNIVGVQLSFSSMTRRRENVTPSATLMTLVGTIGGSLGLAAGFSLLTLTEFVLFLFDVIFHPCFMRLITPKAEDEELGMLPTV